MDVEAIIEKINCVDEVEIVGFDFEECFTALREMKRLLDKFKPLRIEKYRLDGFRNMNYDRAKLSIDLEITDAVKLKQDIEGV